MGDLRCLGGDLLRCCVLEVLEGVVAGGGEEEDPGASAPGWFWVMMGGGFATMAAGLTLHVGVVAKNAKIR